MWQKLSVAVKLGEDSLLRMKILKGVSDLRGSLKGGVLAIGNYDGIHLGHQEILKKVVREAKQKKAPSFLLTFSPHPQEFFSKKKIPRIFSRKMDLDFLETLGLDIVFEQRFDERFSKLGREDFIHKYLSSFAPQKVVVGEDFRFGLERKGDVFFLEKESSFYVEVVKTLKTKKGEKISSSFLRKLLSEGKVKEAEELLGRNYVVSFCSEQSENKGGVFLIGLKKNEAHPLLEGVYLTEVFLEGSWRKSFAEVGSKIHLFLSKPFLYQERSFEVRFQERIKDHDFFSSRNDLLSWVKKEFSSRRFN